MSALLYTYGNNVAVRRTKYAGLKKSRLHNKGIYLRVCRIGSSVGAV